MKTKIITILFVLSFLTNGFILYQVKNLKPRTGWFALNTVFEKFDYKIQLENEVTKIKQHQKFIIDSLSFEINVLNNQGRKSEAEKVYRELVFKQEQFERSNYELQQRYQQQIINQLNQFVIDYAKEQKYEYIFSANGDGTLMAGDDRLDITNKIIEFINLKHSGKR